MEHVRFPVVGMTCTSCVAHITKAVRRLDGVETVKVDLGSDSAAVAFDPSRTSLVAIGAAIEAAGYEPRLAAVEPWLQQPRAGLLARFGIHL